MRLSLCAHQRPPWRILLLLLFPLFLLCVQPSLSQQVQPQVDTNQFINHFPLPDTAVPWRHRYGFNDDEFSIGAVPAIMPRDKVPYDPTEQTSVIWDVMRDLGISIIELRQQPGILEGGHARYDSLINAAIGRDSTGRWHERVIPASWWYSRLGHAREVIFYPFDSSQGYYAPSFFSTRSFGDTASNEGPEMRDPFDRPFKEMVYDTTNTPNNTVVAENIVCNYDTTRHTRRYPSPDWDDLYDDHMYSGDVFAERNDLDLSYLLGLDTDKRKARWLYFNIKAHLFDPILHGGGGADPTDTLLVIELYNERTKNQEYVSWSDGSETNYTLGVSTDTVQVPYKNIYITKNQLVPDSSTGFDYNGYRVATGSIDMFYNSTTGAGGPWHPFYRANDKWRPAYQRFDIKVRWTGKEKLALHSIAVRDTMAQLLFGADSAAQRFRQWMLDTTDRIMYGAAWHNDSLNPNRDTLIDYSRYGKIIRFYTGDEPVPTQYAGFNWFDSTLYQRYGGGDDETKGVRAWHGRNGVSMQNPLLSSDNEISCETYWIGGLESYNRAKFGLPLQLHTKPTLREHNGGRFHHGPVGNETEVFELELDTNSIDTSRNNVDVYSRFMQRVHFGANAPGRIFSPWTLMLHVRSLAAAAWASRNTGRPLIHWPGCFGSMVVQWRIDSIHIDTVINNNDSTIVRDTTLYLDTLVRSFPEPAELRTSVNLGLCYGARGVNYPWVGVNGFFHGESTIDKFSWGSDWGPHGYLPGDTVDRKTISFKRYTDNSYPFDVTIPDLWTGWGVNSAELRWLNKEWLPRIGAELLNLRWRDGYSIHFAVTQNYMDSVHVEDTTRPGIPQVRSRPLPSTEIVNKVEAFDIYGNQDPAEETYVELGLFDKQTDANEVHDPMNDVHHIFVLNRRTFERTSDIDPLTRRGQQMDSLAETRLIKLHLNLPHPDTTQPAYIRVRELAADSTPLPHALWTNRHVLDTAVMVDSAVTLMLGAGRASLLEITYLPPANQIDNAIMSRNGQRNSVLVGPRYYATYTRDSGGVTKIYYRRSYPMRSTDTAGGGASGGAIIWEPLEYEISDDMGMIPARTDHRTPSITARVVPHDTTAADTIITVTWSCVSEFLDAGQREIVLRQISNLGNGATIVSTPIEHVDDINGTNPLEWGTPVVSSLAEGEVVAYSDQSIGILAKFRNRTSGAYTGTQVVDTNLLDWEAKYPTVPTFTQIHEHDSTCGIAWQRSPVHSYLGLPDQIYYTRLLNDPNAPCGGLCPSIYGPIKISSDTTSFNHYHPSLDMHLDVWGGILEGLTWETIELGQQIPKTPVIGGGGGGGGGYVYTPDRVRINFKPLVTQIHSDSVGRRLSILPTETFYPLFVHFIDTVGYHAAVPQFYPNTASLNTRYDWITRDEPVLFSIAFSDSLGHMWQDKIIWGTNFTWDTPMEYTWGGRFANTSAIWSNSGTWLPDSTSTPPVIDPHTGDTLTFNLRMETWDRLPRRPMVLYQILDGADSVLRTTRQYLYAKTRPGGYTATGRDVYLPISDSIHTGINLRLYDVWIATDNTGAGLSMVQRDSTKRKTDSLSQVIPLLRTVGFTASDSVQIGFEVGGGFYGDSAVAGSAGVTCYVELIDSVDESVTAVLDSFTVSSTTPLYHQWGEPIIDLLSGTYYLRLRLEPTSLPSTAITAWSSRYPVDELSGWVANPPLGKLRRTGATSGAQARVTAQPNPSTGATEIRFSIPYRDYVTVTVYDGMGREVARPVSREMMESGRYAIDYDGTPLQAGTYLIEVRTSSERVVEKFIVIR